MSTEPNTKHALHGTFFFLVFGLLILWNYRATMEVSSSDEELIHQSTSEFDCCTAGKDRGLQTLIIMPPLRAVVSELPRTLHHEGTIHTGTLRYKVP